MTNKELAVQLYAASLQANAIVTASPNYAGGNVRIPTIETMIENVKEIANQLATLEDN